MGLIFSDCAKVTRAIQETESSLNNYSIAIVGPADWSTLANPT